VKQQRQLYQMQGASLAETHNLQSHKLAGTAIAMFNETLIKCMFAGPAYLQDQQQQQLTLQLVMWNIIRPQNHTLHSNPMPMV
jgi:hypothetical protein